MKKIYPFIIVLGILGLLMVAYMFWFQGQMEFNMIDLDWSYL